MFDVLFNFQNRFDYLEVYSGNSTEVGVQRRFSGPEKPGTFVESYGNQMLVVFKSDRDGVFFKGFNITYRSGKLDI